jgi:hypothetical protein
MQQLSDMCLYTYIKISFIHFRKCISCWASSQVTSKFNLTNLRKVGDFLEFLLFSSCSILKYYVVDENETSRRTVDTTRKLELKNDTILF